MRKNTFKQTRVTPRGAVPMSNGEAAATGMAVTAQNVREREQSLQVTGKPVAIGNIGAEARLLTMSGGHSVTCQGQTVSIDGQTVMTADGEVVGAHAVGGLMVIVTTDGVTYLSPQGASWGVLDPANAVPQLSFTPTLSALTATLPAYSFAAAYSQWRAPLDQADITALHATLRNAWQALNADARSEGRYTAPLLVRWAVRLMDDTYLWVSEPVRVGDATLANADRVTATVTTGSGGYTGIGSTVLTISHYGLTVGVTRGIDAQWLPLVKCIDVFVTDQAQLVSSLSTLDYRCLTRSTGNREAVLEMGLPRRSSDAIARQLAASSWHLALSAPVSATMSGDDFVAPSVPTTLSATQCAALATPLDATGAVCSAMAGGRLYCCTAGGQILVSAVGNALVQAHRRSVLGGTVMAMAVTTRPLYSSGFGRYPVYVFTDDGIYAIPQSANGTLGEARLVDRTVIKAGVAPVEGGGDVWFVSRHGHLCRLSGSRLTVSMTGIDCRALAWCDAFKELWLLPGEGFPIVRMDSGTLSRRTVEASQLYSDAGHAVAVSADGTLLDLEQEQATMMAVKWRSHPIAMHPLLGAALKRVVWHLAGTATGLTLRVTGQRDVLGTDSDVSVITVDGALSQPLAAPTIAWRMRTVRLDIEGQAQSGTLIGETIVYSF